MASAIILNLFLPKRSIENLCFSAMPDEESSIFIKLVEEHRRRTRVLPYPFMTINKNRLTDALRYSEWRNVLPSRGDGITRRGSIELYVSLVAIEFSTSNRTPPVPLVTSVRSQKTL